ncbi:hypothetical protein LWF15_22230 [Kineosporia rhizophila]|uniref:hypothetical protein n=1 Tax=Kineosporia TaxID=49184 RepID=UPI001E47BF02|nr:MULTISPECIES: hypothetical protein [Kineosporia]MCE0538219.1 hypothetical protein [Kineosporia rhizophila]GLY15057.1 hypothetical protein Kisp01_20720 [Kineosporia sp. NBRC 101677]
MIISEAGFFRELPHGRPDGPSLHEALATGRREPVGAKKEMLLDYLWGNTVLAATAAMFDDVLDPSVTAVAPMAVVTDGAWVWPRDLAHYVDKYDAAVPLPFILHIELRGWEQPALSPNELLQIEQALLEP